MSLLFSLAGYSQSTISDNSFSAVDFRKILETKPLVLIDVRTPAEYSESHIPNAINVNINDSDFTTVVKTFSKGKELALYCRSGRRSKLAISKLSGSGIRIYELNHGFLEWQQVGFPTIANTNR